MLYTATTGWGVDGTGMQRCSRHSSVFPIVCIFSGVQGPKALTRRVLLAGVWVHCAWTSHQRLHDGFLHASLGLLQLNLFVHVLPIVHVYTGMHVHLPTVSLRLSKGPSSAVRCSAFLHDFRLRTCVMTFISCTVGKGAVHHTYGAWRETLPSRPCWNRV